MSAHTPGPWTVCVGDTTYVELPGIAKPINCQNQSNARLIAAAPELLAALREIVGQEKPNRWGYDASAIALDDDWRARARAALAKVQP